MVRMGKLYVFCWSKAPGDNDNEERLRGFLKSKFDINWIENAEIKRTDDGDAIVLSSGRNSVEVRLSKDLDKATVKVNDGRTCKLGARVERGNKLQLYYGEHEIFTTTTETVPGREISELLGTVYAKSLKWTTEVRARNSAMEKVIEQAMKMGADAIVGLRYDREAESGVGAYGTAVKLKPKK